MFQIRLKLKKKKLIEARVKTLLATKSKRSRSAYRGLAQHKSVILFFWGTLTRRVI
jgi:hypothetical protein